MKWMRGYIRIIDAFNHRIGRIIMYSLLVMMGILLWSSISKVFFLPSLWTLEVAQFALVAYFMLGGPYAIQMGSNVRMDLFYGSWNLHRKAQIDAITVFFLIVYLISLLYGALASTAYSFGHFQGEPLTFFAGLAKAFVTGGQPAFGEELGHPEGRPPPGRPYCGPAKA